MNIKVNNVHVIISKDNSIIIEKKTSILKVFYYIRKI